MLGLPDLFILVFRILCRPSMRPRKPHDETRRGASSDGPAGKSTAPEPYLHGDLSSGNHVREADVRASIDLGRELLERLQKHKPRIIRIRNEDMHMPDHET